ncbi:hypothetical protein Tco_0107854, partial [Tanacetum coccineum]
SRPDLSFAGLDDSVYKTKVSETKTSTSKTSKDIVEKPKTVRLSAPIIEEWDTNSDNEKPVLNNKGRVTGQRDIIPVWNNAQRVNPQNKLTHPHPKKNFVPIAVVGAEADLNNLEITMNVSPIPTTRIHKDHPKDQIIGDINSATQTRRMTKISKEHAMIAEGLEIG